MNLLDHALDALRRGFHIFPCKPRSKQPNGELVAHGVNDATNNETIVRAWWQREPNGNIGIALGPSNVTVMDIDHGLADPEAAREWVRRHQVPKTLMIRTGRRDAFGLQLFFRGVMPNKPYEEGGLSGEVRSAGYYVMAPGSIHDKSGEPYLILCDASLQPVPPFVEALARKSLPRPQGKSTERIAPSSRHYYFVERGRELHFAGLSGGGLTAALRWLYENRCVRDPQKDDRVANGELDGIAQWIEEHPAEYPLTTADFVALRHAEKFDEATKAAWAGQLALFDGDREKAFDHLVRVLKKVGCSDERITRIVAASPLYDAMKQDYPEWVKEA